MRPLQGDTSDYELIKHQLSDPDIKVSIDLETNMHKKVHMMINSVYLAVGRPDYQLAAGTQELCYSTGQRS